MAGTWRLGPLVGPRSPVGRLVGRHWWGFSMVLGAAAVPIWFVAGYLGLLTDSTRHRPVAALLHALVAGVLFALCWLAWEALGRRHLDDG